MKKSISDLIKEALLQRGNRSIEIEDTNFFLTLIEQSHKSKKDRRKGNRKRPGRITHFIFFAASLFACLAFMVYITTFLIKDILLFNEKPIVSEAGALIPQRSCNREQVLFHFNAADCWAKTGVQLQRGDRIKISHSGGFNSDVADVYIKIRDNERLKYPYYNNGSERSYDDVEKCIYGKVNRRDLSLWQRIRSDEGDRRPSFGSILWQVNDENNIFNVHPADIHQIAREDATNFIPIDKDGELFLSVNDILLTDKVVKDFNSGKKPIWEDKTLPDSIRNNPLWAKERGLDYLSKKENGVCKLLYTPEEAADWLKRNPELRTVWFHDNVGSVLICVEIERHVHRWQWITRWYRDTERRISWAYEGRNPVAGTLLITLIAVPWSIFRLCWPLLILIALCYLPRLCKHFRKFSFSTWRKKGQGLRWSKWWPRQRHTIAVRLRYLRHRF